MQEPLITDNNTNESGSRSHALSRRNLLLQAGAVSGALLVASRVGSQTSPKVPPSPMTTTSRRGGLLYPQQNQIRNVFDLSGLWQFQLDPQEEGEARGWFKALPAPRQIVVPCSWNDLFDDARDYLGLAWYQHEVYVPSAWRGQRVFLRVGSANYAAKVWVN